MKFMHYCVLGLYADAFTAALHAHEQVIDGDEMIHDGNIDI